MAFTTLLSVLESNQSCLNLAPNCFKLIIIKGRIFVLTRAPPHPALSPRIGGEGRVRGCSRSIHFAPINNQWALGHDTSGQNTDELFRTTEIQKKAHVMHPDDLKAIRTVLAENPAIVFAYLYGSSKDSAVYNDIDIAVYSKEGSNPLSLSADLKIDLSENTGRSPDRFDVRVINHLLEKGDLFSLLYLRDVLNGGIVLTDHDFPRRAAFIEAFGTKYRECEGLIAEVLS